MNDTWKTVAKQYLEQLGILLNQVDIEQVNKIVTVLSKAQSDNSTLFVAGNGGSAATASHWVNDLSKMTKNSGLPLMRVMSLTDNTSWLTALANDEGYERVFAGQLENFAKKDDVLIVISASGNSINLIKAVEMAREKGMIVLGLLGFDGGKLKNIVDDFILISTPKGEYQLVEDCHSSLSHLITTCLMKPRS